MATLDELRELENWLSPGEAGRRIETSGQWVTHLARSKQIRGVKTSLGWLVDPEDVETLARAKKKKRARERRRQQRQQELQLSS